MSDMRKILGLILVVALFYEAHSVCFTNCNTCTTTSDCTACAAGFYLVGGNSCPPCPD